MHLFPLSELAGNASRASIAVDSRRSWILDSTVRSKAFNLCSKKDPRSKNQVFYESITSPRTDDSEIGLLSDESADMIVCCACPNFRNHRSQCHDNLCMCKKRQYMDIIRSKFLKFLSVV
ncbi:hypothetical protein L1987_35520 [Smallanthus sonchifolius]|uniref:Uncharacterized protein n=1 Tax=Smallanthus sonchifolius TaxID=185202 RepID=A0ACB9HWU5_9ASTR|nr:hypothetical protein L1987_35520 [Smallanthus sonchifolius]